MTDAAAVYAAVKSRVAAQFSALPVKWPNEGGHVPGDGSAFVYVEFLTDGNAQLAEFGGGRGANIYAVPARLQAYVCAPVGQGLKKALEQAEAFAAVFRSFKSDVMSCRSATVYPGDGKSDDGNYYHAMVVVELSYRQIG